MLPSDMADDNKQQNAGVPLMPPPLLHPQQQQQQPQHQTASKV